MDLVHMLEQGARKLGISIPFGAYDSFRIYLSMLEETNKTTNLTAIEASEDIVLLHFLDSLALLKVAEFENANVIDIGSGGGFPGVPLKIVDQTIRLTLLDATAKKIVFLSDLCTKLGIEADMLHARAEEAAHDEHLRDRFDIVVSRAVAHLDVLCELCLPFVRVGGVFLAMKSADYEAELHEAIGAISLLGAEISQTHKYELPDTDIVRSIIRISKTAATPNEYPRRFSKIKKHPLK